MGRWFESIKAQQVSSDFDWRISRWTRPKVRKHWPRPRNIAQLVARVVWDDDVGSSSLSIPTMASKVILSIMDDIISDMKSKTSEDLFEEFYKKSPHFKKSWDRLLNKELAHLPSVEGVSEDDSI